MRANLEERYYASHLIKTFKDYKLYRTLLYVTITVVVSLQFSKAMADDVVEIVTEPVVNSLASGNGNDTKNKHRKNRTQKRKEQKKRAKERRRNALQNQNAANEIERESDSGVEEALEDVEIEYVTEELDPKDPMYLYYLKVFEAYRLTAPEDRIKEEKDREEFEQWTRERLAPKAAIVERIVQDVEEAKQEKLREEAGKLKLSKKKLRLLNRPSIGQLKSSTSRPDVVEWHDVTAKDPKLLVHLKSIRNTVPVPRHWCFKRKYLAGKRGFEKPAFDLPDFIKKTGIMEMRQALQEKVKYFSKIDRYLLFPYTSTSCYFLGRSEVDEI
ncbi:Splicing factor 3B subunit 2 [Trichinella britovi]|uniref:Splicing factor 3B subunit 2 n=1 Tax=Trichinella britovi TaxID=45882 RepID=A0A0V1DBQ5_TRIBR|nr:Splicing factor 3B subunit 2 [Trichinella britovi]